MWRRALSKSWSLKQRSAQISGLAKASEILEAQTEDVLRLAEEAAAFIRENLYDESSGEVKRSYRQGPGPTGQADDYAFLIQGALDLYGH